MKSWFDRLFPPVFVTPYPILNPPVENHVMATKQSSPAQSSLAARVLAGYEPTRVEIMALAGSVLIQDEKPKRPRKKPAKKTAPRKRLRRTVAR